MTLDLEAIEKQIDFCCQNKKPFNQIPLMNSLIARIRELEKLMAEGINLRDFNNINFSKHIKVLERALELAAENSDWASACLEKATKELKEGQK